MAQKGKGRARDEERGIHAGYDPSRRITRDRFHGVIGQQASSATGEQPLITSEKPYAHADVYLRTPADNGPSWVGARFRAYAIVGQIRSLEYEVVLAVSPGTRAGVRVLRMRSHGAIDQWEITLQLAVGLPVPAGEYEIELVSFDDACCDDESPPAPSVSGQSTWTAPNALAVQGTLSAGPTRLQKVYGLLDAATAAATFFGLVDKGGAVANGDAFLVAPFPVPDLWPRSFSFGADPRGLRFGTQARWALSSTSGVVTLIGAAGGAIVSAERVP